MEKRRRIGAYGIARDGQGRVLLVRSSSRSNHPGTWYLPGGGLDHGEDPRDGIRREFIEETGLKVALTGLREVSSDLVEFPWRGVLLHHDRIVFDVEVIGGELTTEVDGTTDLPAWIDPGDLPGLELVPFAARTLGLSTSEHEVNDKPPTPDEAGEFAATGFALSGARRVTRFAVYGIVTDRTDRVLLSLIAQGFPGAGSWHLPGGGTDFGELPAEALRREIHEESGQIGQVRELIGVGSWHNPAALGPEGEPLDWYSVQALFRVAVAAPTDALVTEAAGGSTAQARWFERHELPGLPMTDLARRELL